MQSMNREIARYALDAASNLIIFCPDSGPERVQEREMQQVVQGHRFNLFEEDTCFRDRIAALNFYYEMVTTFGFAQIQQIFDDEMVEVMCRFAAGCVPLDSEITEAGIETCGEVFVEFLEFFQKEVVSTHNSD
jgi:hypothetical protein